MTGVDVPALIASVISGPSLRSPLIAPYQILAYGTLINTGLIDSETPLALQNTDAATNAGVLSLVAP